MNAVKRIHKGYLQLGADTWLSYALLYEWRAILVTFVWLWWDTTAKGTYRRVYLVLEVSESSLRQSCEKDTDHHIFKTKLQSLISQQPRPGYCSKEPLGTEAQGWRISKGCAVLIWGLSCVFAKVWGKGNNCWTSAAGLSWADTLCPWDVLANS